MNNTNLTPPFLGQERPVYPALVAMVRVSGVAVSMTSPPIYPGFVQQYDTPESTRDREACYITEGNGGSLGEAIFLGRLVTSYNNKPLYSAVASSTFLGVRVRSSGNTIASATSGIVTWNNPAEIDVGGWYNASSPTFVTCPTAGYYLATANVGFQFNAVPTMLGVGIGLTGGGVNCAYKAFTYTQYSATTLNYFTSTTLTALMLLAAGDAVNVPFNNQTDQGAVIGIVGEPATMLSVAKVG